MTSSPRPSREGEGEPLSIRGTRIHKTSPNSGKEQGYERDGISGETRENIDGIRDGGRNNFDGTGGSWLAFLEISG